MARKLRIVCNVHPKWICVGFCVAALHQAYPTLFFATYCTQITVFCALCWSKRNDCIFRCTFCFCFAECSFCSEYLLLQLSIFCCFLSFKSSILGPLRNFRGYSCCLSHFCGSKNKLAYTAMHLLFFTLKMNMTGQWLISTDSYLSLLFCRTCITKISMYSSEIGFSFTKRYVHFKPDMRSGDIDVLIWEK